MVQKFRTYKRVRSNKAGFARFSSTFTKAEDRFVDRTDVPSGVSLPKVGEFARFQRYTNHNTTTYDLLNGRKRVYSYVNVG